MSEEFEWQESDGAHAEYGPSKASMYLRCLGSINAERGLPDDSGFEAAQGTVFHEYAEMCLKFGLDPDDFEIGTEHVLTNGVGTKWTVQYDQEMVDNMWSGLNQIREWMELDPDAVLYVEQKVDLQRWLGPRQFGTSDVCIVLPNLRRIICFDWKYGGIPVYPFENEQASLYTLGCWNSFAASFFGNDAHGIEVLVHIEQPRAPGGGGQWTTTMTDLLAWAEDVKIKVEASRKPDAPRTAGEKQCRYCKARSTCAVNYAHKLDLFGQEFTDVDVGIANMTALELPELTELTPERLSYIWLNKAAITRWLDSIHDLLVQRSIAGKETPMLKMVKGRAPARKFIKSLEGRAKAAAIGVLGNRAFSKPELLSVAQLDTLMGKKTYNTVLKQYVDEGVPGESLVPIQDLRDPVQAAPDLFTDDDII